ncbi:TolC family outer membrane protein [Crenobacter sp. SG2305]|uniref:TolC family outer membrane protein n=1 Tax=Crenobacter oryzisoli TaxID=3056844 RepID=UPI0025AA71E1|nr:TolC family outer membrane protein [Crenobacter sp. SG2305]MDN0082702.1 TolC family outer membrane protein [Crenobacter sp. SG2305]
MNPKRLTPLAALLALTLAMPASAVDLVGAWQAARDYDATFGSARKQRDAGQEQEVQGLSQLLPQVGLTGNYSNTNTMSPAGIPSYETHGYGVQLTQPLFDVGKYTGYRKGKLGTALADTQFSAAEQQLIVSVAQAYFDVLLARDTLDAVRAAKSAFATQLDQAKAAFQVGTATIVDTYEAQAGYDGAAAKEIVAVSDLEVKENAFRKLTGLDPKGIQRVNEPLVLVPPSPATLEAWQNQALASSLDVKAKEQSLELAKQDVTAKKGQHLPTVALTAGYQDNVTTAPIFVASPSSRASSVGVQLTMPLFTGGGIRSQVREAVAKEEQARDDLEATRRQVSESVRRAYLGVTNGAALVRAQEQLLISAKAKLDSTKLGKEVGVRTNIDLVQAEQAYYEAVQNLASARYAYLNARLQLAQAAGTLEPPVLIDVNRSIGQSTVAPALSDATPVRKGKATAAKQPS